MHTDYSIYEAGLGHLRTQNRNCQCTALIEGSTLPKSLPLVDPRLLQYCSFSAVAGLETVMGILRGRLRN